MFFVFFVSLPPSLSPFWLDFWNREYTSVVLLCFVCFEWILCCDVVCEKQNKNVDKKKKKHVARVARSVKQNQHALAPPAPLTEGHPRSHPKHLRCSIFWSGWWCSPGALQPRPGGSDHRAASPQASVFFQMVWVCESSHSVYLLHRFSLNGLFTTTSNTCSWLSSPWYDHEVTVHCLQLSFDRCSHMSTEMQWQMADVGMSKTRVWSTLPIWSSHLLNITFWHNIFPGCLRVVCVYHHELNELSLHHNQSSVAGWLAWLLNLSVQDSHSPSRSPLAL